MTRFRIAIGSALWFAVIVAASAAVVSAGQQKRWREIAGALRGYISPRKTLTLQAEPGWILRSGDAIFAYTGNNQAGLVGEIGSVGPASPEGKRPIEVILYPSAPDTDRSDYALVYHQADTSLSGVFAALVPPNKRNEIYRELTATFAKHEEEIVQALQPALRDIVTSVTPALEKQLEKSVTKHWGELELILARHRKDLAGDLTTLGKEVGWPIVREQAEPLTRQLANEIWQRVSLWRFGWRYLYGKTGLSNDAMEKEWSRFMTNDALPIIETHVREFSQVAFGVFETAIADPRTKETLRVAMGRIIADPEFQKVTGTILREAIIENAELHTALSEAITRPAVQKSLEEAASPLEPTLRRIGDILFGDGKGGISPELARILRSQVLGKDRQWFTLELVGETRSRPKDAPAMTVRQAIEPSIYPLP